MQKKENKPKAAATNIALKMSRLNIGAPPTVQVRLAHKPIFVDEHVSKSFGCVQFYRKRGSRFAK